MPLPVTVARRGAEALGAALSAGAWRGERPQWPGVENARAHWLNPLSAHSKGPPDRSAASESVTTVATQQQLPSERATMADWMRRVGQYAESLAGNFTMCGRRRVPSSTDRNGVGYSIAPTVHAWIESPVRTPFDYDLRHLRTRRNSVCRHESGPAPSPARRAPMGALDALAFDMAALPVSAICMVGNE